MSGNQDINLGDFGNFQQIGQEAFLPYDMQGKFRFVDQNQIVGLDAEQ